MSTRTVHYCTYCHHYARDHVTGELEPGRGVFTGTRAEVVAHADMHPIGDPEDMALPLESDIGLWVPASNESDPTRPWFAYRETTTGENRFRLDKIRGKHIRYATREGAQLAAQVLNRKGQW